MDDLFNGAGALRCDYEAVDWAAGPLGPSARWSPTLRAAVDFVLNTKVAATLLWGPQFVLVYNEAYVPLIADKHPAALGARAADVFPEIWDVISPLLDGVLAGHGAVFLENLRLELDRRGFAEECYFTFSYSAMHSTDLPSEDRAAPGRRPAEGVVDVVVETTAKVQARRRLETLAELTKALAECTDVEQSVHRMASTLRANSDDIPHLSVSDAAAGDPVESAGAVRWSGSHVELWYSSACLRATYLIRADALERQLTADVSPHIAVDDSYLDFFAVIATLLNQTIERITMQRDERLVALGEKQMSETLQRSMLTEPIQPDHLQVAARYQPAVEQAQVGGDWYDAFLGADGDLTLVVGDVAGHDRFAAAAMGQLRNLLRGISFSHAHSPAATLSSLDAVMRALTPGVLATVLLARVEQDDLHARRDERVLRWSSAGHLPPALLGVDGDVRLLESQPELLLGLRPDTERQDRTVTLEPGASVVFYTDGLIERRDEGIDDGLAALRNALAGQQHLDAEQLCDHLLAEFAGNHEDDIVLLVVHAKSEQGSARRAD